MVKRVYRVRGLRLRVKRGLGSLALTAWDCYNDEVKS